MKPLGMNTTINGGEKEEEGVSWLVGEVSGKKLIPPLELIPKSSEKRDSQKQSTGHFP
jgi:hypothetical protein